MLFLLPCPQSGDVDAEIKVPVLRTRSCQRFCFQSLELVRILPCMFQPLSGIFSTSQSIQIWRKKRSPCSPLSQVTNAGFYDECLKNIDPTKVSQTYTCGTINCLTSIESVHWFETLLPVVKWRNVNIEICLVLTVLTWFCL